MECRRGGLAMRKLFVRLAARLSLSVKGVHCDLVTELKQNLSRFYTIRKIIFFLRRIMPLLPEILGQQAPAP